MIHELDDYFRSGETGEIASREAVVLSDVIASSFRNMSAENCRVDSARRTEEGSASVMLMAFVLERVRA